MGGGRYNRPADQAVLDAVKAVAAKRGEAPAQVAIAWLLSNPAVTAPIVGATRAEQLDEPLKAVDAPLSADEVAALEAPYEAQAVIGALRAEDMPMREIRATSQPRPVSA
jgi:aryl-alcohol dehydrogenase-like predicted oxidoreductase